MTRKPDTFSKSETAAMLGVSERTLDRLRHEGKIGYRQVGDRGYVRFAQEDIDAYQALADNTVVVVAPTAKSATPVGIGPGRRKRPTGDLSGPAAG